MAMKNPDSWAPTHMRRLALSRWTGEGGASPWRVDAEPAAPAGTRSDEEIHEPDPVTTSPSTARDEVPPQ
jgi:hypothetical protein